ncbi:MAG: iron-sulfur cluster assembly scaffold protein [Ectothiorhodospiraceae bacterium]
MGPLAWQHYREPCGVAGEWLRGDRVATGAAGAVSDGVQVIMQLRVAENGLIDAVRWQAMGPPEVIAASSWLATTLPGVSVAAAGEWSAVALVQVLELSTEATSHVLAVEDALTQALVSLPSL